MALQVPCTFPCMTDFSPRRRFQHKSNRVLAGAAGHSLILAAGTNELVHAAGSAVVASTGACA